MEFRRINGLPPYVFAHIVALTLEASDRTIRTREKLEEVSGLPTLAELPGNRGSAPRFGTDAAFDDAVRWFGEQGLLR